MAAPPPQVAPQAGAAAQTIVIAPPAPEEPEAQPSESSTATAEPPKRPVRRRRTIRTDASTEEADEETEPASPAPEVPALETHESSQALAARRRELIASQESTRKRLAQLDHAHLDAGDRRTLNDAKAFLAQSDRELERGEILRAINLARKAALLVSAIEQSH